jgi:methylenetetrahydrofolate reductase (NADPH)
MHWMRRQAAAKPMLACLMSVNHGRAAMLDHVAGVTVTPSMREMLEAETAQSKAFAQSRSVDRLALQIIGTKLMGYAGVHLSGIHDLKQLLALEARLAYWQTHVHTLEQWAPAWQASWQMPGLPAVTFHPPQANWRQGESRVDASFKEKARYHLMHGMHGLLFSRRNSLSKAFGWAVRQPLWTTRLGAQVLHTLERSVKRPLVGCDTCGRCRLEDTLYTCPETCPKGLANGPCGGTALNRCEFGDRECIHSIKYRTAKAVGQTAVLRERLIPCIEEQTRHRSSWPQWFAPPSPGRVSPQPAPRTQPES